MPSVTSLVEGAATRGNVAIVEVGVVRGQEPPFHIHEHEDEIVYVLAGRLTVWIDGDPHHVAEGDCLVLPRGIEHGHAVASDEARLLVILTPAGAEPFFHGASERDDAPVEIEPLVSMAACYGITITTPAPSVDAARPSSAADDPA